MNIDQLYEDLKECCQGGILTLIDEVADGAYYDLLRVLAKSNMTLNINNCVIERFEDKIIVSGNCQISPYTDISAGSIRISSYVNGEEVYYDSDISIAGEGTIAVFLKNLIPEENVFGNFTVSYPTLTLSKSKTESPYSIHVTGSVKRTTDEKWDKYSIFIPKIMSFEGMIKICQKNIYEVYFDFDTNMTYNFLFGEADVTLAMRAMRTGPVFHEKVSVKAYLFFKVKVREVDEDMTFLLQLFTEGDKSYSSAYFSPALSVGQVAKFIYNMFGVEQSALLLPEDTALSSFGLTTLDLILRNENQEFKNLSIERASMGFMLEKPWNMPLPRLTLEDFRVIWELSWWNEQTIVTLDARAAASLKLSDKYTLNGRVRGGFPHMLFEGELSLDEDMSIGQLADGFNTPLPEQWKSEGQSLADFLIWFSVRDRSLSITGEANDILTVNIGTLSLSIKSITARVDISPSETRFGFSGLISFDSGDNEFAFQLDAGYSDGWYFSGRLAYGVVSIGKLLGAMFSIEVPDKGCFDVIIDDFSISYSTTNGLFELYASFDTVWFKIFNVTPELGGRIRLQKSDDTDLSASAALYLDIGIFHILAQANNFYDEEARTFLFRVGLWDFYVQGVYSKNKDGDELLTISLSDQTLGDVVLALIHLINPNAKTQLSAPWNVLNEIRLSAFSLVINTTKNTADFLYNIGLTIPGLMEIKEIGLRYDKENESDKIKYIVTGKLLNTEYTSDDPLTWDAVDGMPPANTAAGEQKTKVKYIGIGAHLAVNIESGSISGIIEELKKQLAPPAEGSVPEFHYSDSTEWIFGTDLTLADLFSLQLVLLDPTLYGGKITVCSEKSESLKALDGLEIELMYQKISSAVGMLRCAFTPPKVFSRFTLGAVTISIGQITAEIYTNGSFLIDLGFPHNNDFSRSFGIEFGIYTGSGGIYFGALKGDAVKGVPAVTNGAFSPVVLIGVGLKVGLGRSFDLGIVKGGVSLTVTGILEGVFGLFNSTDGAVQNAMYYRVSALAEIAGTLFLSADLCIISVSLSASVSASCELTIESYRKSLVALELSMHLGASIKILFIKISFSFDFHQKVSFTFGEDTQAPWKLADQSRNERLAAASIDDLFPIKKLGDWKIEAYVTPLLSLKDPKAEEKKYCIAFMSVLETEPFADLVDMLLSWLIAAEEGESVTYAFAAAIDSKAADGISLDMLESFLSENLNINVSAAVESDKDEIAGVTFPMLHKLILLWNDTSVDFGENAVTSDYFEEISEYFANLNADPLHEVDFTATNDTMPFCGAIVLDYFRMILSELIARLKRLFGGLEVKTADLEATAQTYGVSVSELLADNRDLTVHIDSLLFHTHTVDGGETLSSIAGKYGMEAAAIWSDIKDLPLIIDPGARIKLEQYKFDNRKARLTPEDAAALFFVRLYDPEIIYISYADKLVADNDLQPDWECETPYERTITVSRHGSRPALAGDTVVRVAKAAAVADGAYDGSDWTDFRQAFLAANQPQGTEIPESYIVSGETGTGIDNTPVALARRLFPDFTQFSEENILWTADFLCALKQITLRDVTYGQSVPVSAVDAAELAAAVEGKTAALDGEQAVKVTAPSIIPKDDVFDKVLAADSVSEIGAMISRFFMQGLRVPPPDGGEMTPLYELTRQQFDLADTESDINMTLTADESCTWVTASAETVTLTADMIKRELPAGDLPKESGIDQLPDFTQTGKYWGVGDKRGVKLAGEMWKLLSLPTDLRRYISVCKTAPVLMGLDGQAVDTAWCCAVEIRLIRQSRNVFTVIGAAADDRRLLHGLIGKPFGGIQLLYKPSKLTNSELDLTGAEFGKCVIIRSNLSLQTHMDAVGGALSYEHSADITDTATFTRLMWECSTVGGGYLLYIDTDCLPDHVFDGNGIGELTMLITLDGCAGMDGAVNSALVKDYDGNAAFCGDEEKSYMPNAPVGCAVLQTRIEAKEDSVAELFHVMHYRAKTGDKTLESAPLLPRQEVIDNVCYNVYYVTVPLYRLCGGETYSAVGKEVPLTFYLNDVLGNTTELSTVTVKGAYNDFLISANELPRTQVVYGFDSGDGPALVVSFIFRKNEEQDENPTDAEIARALTAMVQAADDVSLSVSSSFDNTPHTSSDLLSGYRNYVTELHGYLSGGSGTEPSDFSIRIPVDTDQLPNDIFALSVSLAITRNGCSYDYDGVRTAVSTLVPDCEPAFSEAFAAAFPELKLAYDSEHNIYAVPFGTLIQEIAVSPYQYENISTPEIFAVKPFSTSLITREVEIPLDDGTAMERTYMDCDLQSWIKRFLNDVQTFTGSDTACRAAVLAPDVLDALIDAKKLIAGGMAQRVVPISDDFSRDHVGKVQEEAEDLYLRSLSMVYDVDVLLAYNLSFKVNADEKHFRMETALVGASQNGLSAQKLDTDSDVFCMYSTSSAKKLTEIKDASMSLLHLEYDISSEESGYEDSKWLRLASPMESGQSVFSADLRADAGIPHPRNLCPLPPSIKSHSYEADEEKFLGWNYTVTVSCEAYEQYTVYLKLLLDEPNQAVDAARDIFDILAEYDFYRADILSGLAGNDDAFIGAYGKILPLAKEFSQALGSADKVRVYEAAGDMYITLKITFTMNENKVDFIVTPDEESAALLERLGASVEPVALVSGGAIGEPMTFDVKLSGLPIYDCARVKPCAWIVQNENLFEDNAFPISEAFIFRTTESSLDFLNARARYATPIAVDPGNITEVVQHLWDKLELSGRNLAVSLSVSYEYAVSGGNDPLRVSLPVTFIPDMASIQTVAENIAAWVSSSGVSIEQPRLVFDVFVHLPENDNYLVNARIQSPLSSL